MMKNTFKTMRARVNDLYPYWVEMPDGSLKYLFEVTRKTTLKDIIHIEDKFDDDQIIFATIDPKFSKQQSTIDSANLHECGERKRRPFYFYKNGKFYITVKIKKHNGHYRDSVTLATTDTEIFIREYLPF